MSRVIVGGLDIETTGLDQPEGHRIIELAVILHDLDTQKEIGRYETRINPERGIDAKAQEVHGIAYEDLVDKPLWTAIAPKVGKLLSHCHYVVAHNGVGFDMPFLFGELIRVGEPLPSMGVIDTMLQGRWATPDGAVPNLGALAFASNVPYDKSKAHAATYDVEVMLACFFKHYPKFFQLPTAPYQYQLPVKEKKK